MISRSTSCGLAPGQIVSIVSVGICTSGVSCIGIENIAMMPNSTIRMTPTDTLTGLWTNVSIRFIVVQSSVVSFGVANPSRRWSGHATDN